MPSDNRFASVIVAAVLGLFAAGCQEGGSTDDGLSTNGSNDRPLVRESGSETAGLADSGWQGLDSGVGLDFGEDWLEEGSKTARTAGRSRRNAAAGSTKAYWSIVLRSFTDGDHARAAATMLRSVSTVDPKLGTAHARTIRMGSMVLYGRYDGPDDPAAKKDLKWVHSLKGGNRTVFPKAFLSRISADQNVRELPPEALMSVRRLYPDANPMYTLQVAVWGEFGGGSLSPEEVRRQAAAYARKLRTQRHQAYYHHDDRTGLSMVTVGLFDHTAIDAQSGLLSPEVEKLMEKFPVHLVNGETLNVMIDRRRPRMGTRIQRPKLVLVPPLR